MVRLTLNAISYLCWEGFLGGASSKEPTCQSKRLKRHRFVPWIRKSPWRWAWQPTPVFLPGESYGQRSMVGYSPWGCKQSDTTEATACSHLCWNSVMTDLIFSHLCLIYSSCILNIYYVAGTCSGATVMNSLYPQTIIVSNKYKVLCHH